MPHGSMGDGESVMPRWKRWLRPVLAAVAISIAAASIFISLGEGWSEIKLSEFVLSVRGAIALIAGVTGTLVLSAIYHTLLLSSFQSHDARSTRVAYAYAWSQLLRYVPGKVVGVVFQISMLKDKIRPASIVSALMVHTIHDYAWAFVFCGILLWALQSGSFLALILFGPALLAVQVVHKHGVSQKVLARLPVLGRHVPRMVTGVPSVNSTALTSVLAVMWVPMLAGIWLAFAPLLGSQESLVAGLLYLIAAVVSLAMIVVPSGLVVREAVFLWLGDLLMLPAGKLVFMALVIRIGMTLAEIATTLVLAAMDSMVGYRQARRGAGH